MNRPFLWIAVSLLLGVSAAAAGVCPGVALPSLLALAGLAVSLVVERYGGLRQAGVLLIFFGGGALLWTVRNSDAPGDPLSRYVARQPPSQTYTLRGTVEHPDTLTPGRDYMKFHLRVDTVNTLSETPAPIHGKVLVRWSDPGFPVFNGDTVEVSGPLSLQLGRVNFGVYDFEDHLRARGVHSELRLRGEDTVTLLRRGSLWSPFHLASRFRLAQADRLAKVVPESSLPLVLTVWLGERSLMDPEAYRPFVESGTAHILAVSGVHTGIIFVTITVLLDLLLGRKRRRLHAALTMTAVLIFALTAGARIPSMRAALMIFLYLSANFFDREPDAPTALSLAAILFTLHRPNIVFDPGFQLSFLSIASIFLFSGPIKGKLSRLPGWLQQSLAPTLAVQILALPVAVSLFHVLPLIGPAVNLLVIPLLSVVLWLTFLTSSLALVSETVATLFGHAIDPFVYFIHRLASLSADTFGAHVYLTKPTSWAVVLYMLTAALLYAFLRSAHARRRSIGGAALATLIMTSLFWRPFRHEPEVTFMDVGQGDATFVRAPGGQTALIDGGDRNDFVDMGRRVVAPYLWANRVSHIDAVFATHADRDHIGGLLYVLDRFSVGALYLGPFRSYAQAELDLVEKAQERGIPVHRIARGDRITLGRATVDVLHPPRDWPEGSSDNDRSLTLRLSWPGMSALLTGDIEARAEAALVGTECAAAILKVPHHGSDTSSTVPFIRSVNPTYCTVSAGRSRHKTIDAEVLERYRELGVQVFRTDAQGGIRFTSENGRIKVQRARTERGYLVRASD